MRYTFIVIAGACLTLAVLLGVNSASLEDAKKDPVSSRAITTSTVAGPLEYPWGMAFLPDGRILVTERAGNIRIVQKNGVILPPLQGVPDVFFEGQGGLLDIAIPPDFSESGYVYFSYAEPEEAKAGTAVARAILAEGELQNVEVIFRQLPKVEAPNHFGSRLVFDRSGHLFITLGERFDYSDMAQTLDNHMGKVIRIFPDGSIPDDNPFVGQKNALPEIWSYGHRNSQGAALHPDTGVFWMHEHGPRGGDEVNIPEAGKNYGWPEVSYGSHYTYIPIPDGHIQKGYQEPIYYWDPSIAPSGMTFYIGTQYPEWMGSLFVGALAGQHITRLQLEGQKVVAEEKLMLTMPARIRDIEVGVDGYLYILTDDYEGQILRIDAIQ